MTGIFGDFKGNLKISMSSTEGAPPGVSRNKLGKMAIH